MVEREDRLSGRRSTSTDPDIRSEFERDVDRVFYNYYFRRLAEITQVSSGDDRVLRHNRMTHSLKVAQVGRRLVQYLENDQKNREGIAAAGGIDRNVVFAAGLLHDAGHPPFGHIGEQQLDRIARSKRLPDGFEGNAQTLRILLSLTVHKHDQDVVDGLDLTRAVIAACVKYPWPHEAAAGEGKPNKWGYYDTERDTFKEFVEPALPKPRTPTLEAQIMDWADDITYAVHDLQDFYTDGIIPLHHLRYRNDAPTHQAEFSEFWGYVAEKLHRSGTGGQPTPDARKHFERYAASFPEGRFRHTREETAEIGALASRLITDASKATAITRDGELYVDPAMRSAIQALKQVTWFYVIDHPNLVSTQIGQRAQINQVFSKLYKRVEFCYKRKTGHELSPNEQWLLQRRLPAQLREITDKLLKARYEKGAYEERGQCYTRAVIDYIGSMTEVEFVRLRDRLCPVENYSQVEDGDFYRGDEGV